MGETLNPTNVGYMQVPQSSTVLLKGGSGVMNGSKDFAKDIHSLFSAHEKVSIWNLGGPMRISVGQTATLYKG